MSLASSDATARVYLRSLKGIVPVCSFTNGTHWTQEKKSQSSSNAPLPNSKEAVFEVILISRSQKLTKQILTGSTQSPVVSQRIRRS